MQTKTTDKSLGQRSLLLLISFMLTVTSTGAALTALTANQQVAYAGASSGSWSYAPSTQCQTIVPGNSPTTTNISAQISYNDGNGNNGNGSSIPFSCSSIAVISNTQTTRMTLFGNDTCKGQTRQATINIPRTNVNGSYLNSRSAEWIGETGPNCSITTVDFTLSNAYAENNQPASIGTGVWSAVNPGKITVTYSKNVGSHKSGTTETFSEQGTITSNLMTLQGNVADQKDCPTSPDVVVVGQTQGALTDKHATLGTTVWGYNGSSLGCSSTGGVITLTKSYADAGGKDDSGTLSSSGDQCPLDPSEALRWIACPLIVGAQNALLKIIDLIGNFLYVPADQIFGANSAGGSFQNVFNTFRNIGISLLVIAGLAMVASQAAGLEIFAAYTVRKALPRIVIATIGMALAWPLLQFIVVFFNDLGTWIGQIILTATHTTAYATDVGQALVGIVTTVIGLLAYFAFTGPEALFALVGTLLLSLLVGFIVLAIRQLVIVLCILLAPLAIASSILPGTEKLWNFWRDALIGALLMFPIIMGMLSSGIAVAYIASAAGSAAAAQGQQGASLTWNLLAVIVCFAPFFMLPFAFRLASGIMGGVVSAVTGVHGGLFKSLAERRQEAGALHRERRIGRPVLQARSHLATASKQWGSRGGRVRRLVGGFAAGAVGGYNVESRMSALQAAMDKEMQDQTNNGEDSEWRGLTVNRGWARRQGPLRLNDSSVYGSDAEWASNGQYRVNNSTRERQYRTLGGGWVNEASVDRAFARHGHDTFAQKSALQYEMGKATEEEDVQNVARSFNNVADAWGMSNDRRGGAWLGAAFGVQGTHLEYKRMKRDDSTANREMTLATGGDKAFVDEIYNKRGSYNLAQMGSNTIEELKKAYVRADENGDIDTKNKIGQIAETFMHSYGSSAATENGQPGANGEGGRRQANTPGAAHVAERVYELARTVQIRPGVSLYDEAPRGDHVHDRRQTPDDNQKRMS